MGVVGSATAKLFSTDNCPVLTYDIRGTGNCSSVREVAERASIVFVCVPTPQGLMNRLNTSIVADVCKQLHEAADGPLVTVVRSTVPIGTCKTLPGTVVYNPEFCNARTAYEDMVCAERVVLGGPLDAANRVRGAYENAAYDHGRTMGHGWAYVLTSWEDAEALKLVTNAAMAVKITFANEAAVLCNRLGADWAHVSRMLSYDKRLGNVGWDVPGPDGMIGFGGACLPKDLAGYVALANTNATPIGLAEAAQRQNNAIRKAAESWRALAKNLHAAEGDKP